ncbi:MAG: His-Xaa-Ser system radical SAM maturase HxsB [Candidatus Moranbacteria bacterium]|nr:His-Xaa-Ser system radical SAM maturase HxsB [Candidatus Moranbacteria bacterium]
MSQSYRFLPFRFERVADRVLLVNDVGDFHFLPESSFDALIGRKISPESSEYLDLKSKNMIWDSHLSNVIDLLATKYRTKKQFLYDFTSLHMFVLTRRCNQRCAYCHASSVCVEDKDVLDMDVATARKCVELVFMSPAKSIKIEFQGGEPLLNFNVLKSVVEYSLELNEKYKKNLEFVVCTNLIALDEDKLEYIKSNKIYISTSLDGPEYIHDEFRKNRSGEGSYKNVTANLALAQSSLGHDNISALMTVTDLSIDHLDEVIDEYIARGLGSIFLRMLNPLGYASAEWNRLGYSVDDFVDAYAKALDKIIQINRSGVYFPEMFTTLLLSRILTPFSTGFVDLQSPAGVGIGGVIYDTNGDVYVSDEARMLAHSKGDKSFCVGNAHSHSWREIFGSERLREIISSSCIEALPGCAWCVFQSYCGADPVRNYAVYGDMVGKRPENDFCRKHKAIFRVIFEYLAKDDEDIEDIFWSWIIGKPLAENSANATQM